MAISAQDKILYVANKLGLSTLKDMQGSTGAIYDCDTEGNGVIFNNASQHNFPGTTNLSDNKFEVNEALLVETIGFYGHNPSTTPFQGTFNLISLFPQDQVVVFDLVIGNKVVIKDTPVFAVGGPQCFSNFGVSTAFAGPPPGAAGLVPRHQIYLEGAGILIPPQVEFYIQYKVYNVVTGDSVDLTLGGNRRAAYLFGTKVNLNFNTTI